MKKRIFSIAMLAILLTLPVFASTTSGTSAGSAWMSLGLGAGAVGMGLVSLGTLASLQKSFNAIYNETLAAMPPNWPNYAMEVGSTGAAEDYQWLGDTPAMREWLGDKFVKEVGGFHYTVPNKSWEVTIGVKRDDIDDDRLGMYRPKIAQLAEEGVVKQDSLLSELREAGTGIVIYDGKSFYAANHQTGKSGAQSNLLAGTGVAIDKITADFRSARAAMRKFKTDQGKPFIRQAGKLKFHITCPPDLEGMFELLSVATTIAQTDNVLKGAFTYSVDMNLTDTIDWYLDYVGSAIRPFVMQMRDRPHLVALDQPTSETVFTRGEFQYSTEGRFNAAFGLWPYSIKINNA